MGASQFVGRVGGLAVALGVGVAVFSGAGVASADRSAPDTRGSAGNASDGGSASESGAPVRGRGTPGRGPSAAAASTVVAQTNTSRLAAPVNDSPVTAPAAAAEAAPEPTVDEPAVEPLAEVVVEPSTDGSDPAPDVVEEPEAVAYDLPAPVDDGLGEPKVIVDPVVEEPETATPGDVNDVVMYATGGTSDGAGTDPSPVDSSLSDLVLASWIRREVTGTASAASPTAQASASTPLTAAPKTVWFDGILQGNFNVTAASGCGTLGSTCKLVYSFVGSSDGGKVSLNNVPAGLPGGGPLIQGANGSFSFVPYATWIDSAKPTNLPTPTGTQSFTVRVAENTKFDQTITGIPLIGLFAPAIIKLLQTTPFLGTLLTPLIGASITQTVSVDVGKLVPVGKQVAYTYMVKTFDDTLLSTNYFPASTASLILPGQRQATIYSGPGLGGAGLTDPYGLYQAAGSAPGLALMRGFGLPAPFTQAPLGFNVITWDPPGEYASGGTLELDSPFNEGRKVSDLITWGINNTPLLQEGGVPKIVMMGGSYGAGVQMTTVDPRIQAIVPSIGWNNLNNALYPNQVFKTGWANALALALLGSGASSIGRVDSLITQALLTGNLFGFISQSAQAALNNSGPTVLLKKLSIPTFYDQGIVDALFSLQEALNNARTQLDENPYFAGDNADQVKMFWFNGGHGVANLTPKQLQDQATVMFLENILWVNNYSKEYLNQIPITPVAGLPFDTLGGLISAIIGITPAFQWYDQNGTALASSFDMPWTAEFQDTPPIVAANTEGGRINSFTSRTGPLTAQDPTGAVCQGVADACKWPLNQVFATEAKNAVNVNITVPRTIDSDQPSVVVGAPKVSFTYSGRGNAKAVYAQVVDNATGQVLGNIDTAIPIILDGKEHTIDSFAIANIVYTAPGLGGNNTLTLQIVGNSSLYKNNAVIWSMDISKVAVSLPTTSTAAPNPIVAYLPV